MGQKSLAAVRPRELLLREILGNYLSRGPIKQCNQRHNQTMNVLPGYSIGPFSLGASIGDAIKLCQVGDHDSLPPSFVDTDAAVVCEP